uniref:14 kDa phosphohistidine phosphatase n=1 Tax=Calcidiscus leptoporus TaxID=127549 RepID=A0A7S0J9N9_9EUKA|mmetsp:Transcript_46297/g.107763  ORF Transcript_46297/g.107763 Transcript_46297/m.107763 type:complete len:117 (+) Transcript_46297:153-503(+)
MRLADCVSVEIDEGIFKYVLIAATECSTGNSMQIVRGYGGCEYHADVLATAAERLGSEISLTCLGGGRIAHDANAKKVHIYGYSMAYGRANHAESCKMCCDHFGDGYSVSWADEGY